MKLTLYLPVRREKPNMGSMSIMGDRDRLTTCLTLGFRCLPNYGNDLRIQYNTILSEIAGSNLLAYLVSGLLLLALPWPSTLAAALVLPYLANVVPYLRLDEAECERAHAGWRRFLWLNYLTGFLLTQLIIVVPIGMPGR